MAQIDSSIYFQQKSPDLVGSISQGLSMRQVLDKINKQKASDQAYQSGIVTNPDGTTSFDQNKTLAGLAKVGGKEYFDAKNSFTEQALADQKQKYDQFAKQVDFIGRAINGIKDQDTYGQYLSEAKQHGLDVSAMPPQWGPEAQTKLNFFAGQALSIKDKLDQQNKERQFQQKDTENKYKHEENTLKRQEIGGNKQNQSMQQTIQLLESARGNPAAAQAEKDLYAADKANSLANLYGDPNKLSTPQVNLLVSEVGKIASGGVPAMHELDGLSPGTLQGAMASAWSKLSNNPTPANAGAFVKQYQDYTDALAKDAKKVINDKYGRIIDSKKGSISKSDYESLKSNYLDRFNQPEAQAAQPTSAPAASHPQANDALNWAKQNPNDPRAAAILQRLGQ